MHFQREQGNQKPENKDNTNLHVKKKKKKGNRGIWSCVTLINHAASLRFTFLTFKM